MSKLGTKRTWAMGAIVLLVCIGGFGCPGEEDLCDSDIIAKVNALSTASNNLATASTNLKLEIGEACYNIATDLGDTTVSPITAASSDTELSDVCTAAATAIETELSGGLTIDVLIQGGYCEVDAQAQFSCEASCDIEGGCEPGSVEVRCDPGELSVECDAACEAEAYCQGSVEVAANCSGSCSATCDGVCGVEVQAASCEGTCVGECDGSPSDGACAGSCTGTCGEAVAEAYCDARCEGSCTGECHLAADASIECGANVRCRGGCTGTATAPRCEGEIEPPSCNIDADCQAGCEGQASLNAECYPPEVLIVADGGVSDTLVTTLEENFPAIYNGFEQEGALMVESAVDVAEAAADVLVDVGNLPLCAFLIAGDVATSMTAAAEASVTVSVSFEASASVGTSCGAN